MLPVSGALQLNTSGAQYTRPMISHSGAYSRFVSSPPNAFGQNRFHNPAARASPFNASISRSGIQGSPLRRLASISSWWPASFG